ncbi:MAG TPA: hypothetical protein VL172_16245 [Kofleriaceae bacterium]|nr:hypothetical protein [Kofleriaceae bacterium]
MPHTLTAAAETRLSQRGPLPLDPTAAIAIKRDVHEFEIDADADAFARAFAEAMADPDASFGLIRIRRSARHSGTSFAVGERFQGCFSLEAALLGALRGRPRARRLAERLLARPAAARLVGWIEDSMLSDYGEIVDLDDGAGAHRLRYRYLDGTPIAGSSIFEVEPLGPGRCRVRQVFEYQEVNAVALGTFQRFGLKFHDQVVHMQIAAAAQRCGARVLRGTIPAAYAAAGRA